MSESADHLLDELSKKLVDEAIPSAQHHLEQEEKETKSHQKTPPSSLNDSFADDVLDKETKLINTDDSSVSSSFLFFCLFCPSANRTISSRWGSFIFLFSFLLFFSS
ncbi:hypothetical protein CRE_09013 [Caenorhabditis remanei]|uniref:Uncharacterized protein n=1 Tax=Caenorhabditis remanei TaxID=31234 RepID=E3LIT2_CAERE|nr:hypothetical protein CRE_09013 [Caenorhabditis remanei]